MSSPATFSSKMYAQMTMSLAPSIAKLNKFELSKLTRQLVESENHKTLELILTETDEFKKSVASYRAIEEILDNPESCKTPTVNPDSLPSTESDDSDVGTVLLGHVKKLEKYRDALSANKEELIPSAEQIASESGLALSMAQTLRSSLVDEKGMCRIPCQKFIQLDDSTLEKKYGSNANEHEGDLMAALMDSDTMLPMMLDLMICGVCHCFKTAHKACAKIEYKDGNEWSECIKCSLDSSEHQTCQNFQYVDGEKRYSPTCLHCNKSRTAHQDQMRENGEKVCYNYQTDGHECCLNCKFNKHDHVDSQKVRALNVENQRKIRDLSMAIAAASLTSKNLDCQMIQVLVDQLIYVDNYMKIQLSK